MSDYISREAAFKEFAEFVRGSNNSDFVDAPTWNDAVSLIGSLPAADVVGVVHGKWIKSPECPEEYDICSVCGLNDKHRTRADCEHPAFESIPLFCKWCGAKMDGGSSDA